MKNSNGKVIAGLITFFFTVLASFSYGQNKSMTVTGEVVDMACYMAKGAKGEGHKDCASACIKGGSPVGVLTSDGKVYLLVENHDKQSAYADAKKMAAAQVTVTGTYTEKGGVQALIVDEVKAKM